MSENVMVDLETYDTRHSACILSIGAVRMDFETGRIFDEFYTVVDLESCKAIGLTECPNTKAWWDRQSPEARKCLTDPGLPIRQALANFTEYLRKSNLNKVKVWGCGVDFDNMILQHAYRALGFANVPWRFYNNRCYRTVREFLNLPQEERRGTYHNALDDAKHQARVLMTARDVLKEPVF